MLVNNKINKNQLYAMGKTLIICALLLFGIGTMTMKEAIAGSFSLKVRSLVCGGDVTGIAQQECPTGEGSCTIKCELLNAEVDYLCQNNGGGTGGFGSPFHGTLFLSSELNAFNDTPLDGTGKEFVTATISDAQIITALMPLCDQNDNWSIAVEAGACANDDANHLRAIALVTSTTMKVTAKDAQGDETTYLSNCTLNSYYNDLNQAPLCPEDAVTSGIEFYTCSNRKTLNLK